jgi:hypothetical protein
MIDLKKRSELTAINIVNAILAPFLFISPWSMGFRDLPAATWNAWSVSPSSCLPWRRSLNGRNGKSG